MLQFPSNWSLEEKGRVWEQAGCGEIAAVYYELADLQSAVELKEAELEKLYGVRLEQSEFRAQALEAILTLCDEETNCRELIKGIRIAIENCGVEL